MITVASRIYTFVFVSAFQPPFVDILLNMYTLAPSPLSCVMHWLFSSCVCVNEHTCAHARRSALCGIYVVIRWG